MTGMPGRKRKRSPSFARLDAFARGEIWGMRQAGAPREDIVKRIKKKDGRRPTLRAVAAVIARKAAHPEWRGEDSVAGGRPCTLTPKQERRITRLVFKYRGKAKVTLAFVRKLLKFARKVSAKTVGRSLHRAGLKWMVRRVKRAVPFQWRGKRRMYARWPLLKVQRMLDRFAYTDGTCFYLARCDAEADDKKRAALGKRVWRMANGKDGLHTDNIGPSLYAKAQGRPVKIWGFFANGRLEYAVLPKDGYKKTKHMNGKRYNAMIKKHFPTWRRACFGDDAKVHLVQDHERCLWQARQSHRGCTSEREHEGGREREKYSAFLCVCVCARQRASLVRGPEPRRAARRRLQGGGELSQALPRPQRDRGLVAPPPPAP